MNVFQSVILGAVEGLTEFLPVSSTGHLILATELLKLEDGPAMKAFEVVIQSGAVLAVLWYYRAMLKELFSGLRRGRSESVQLFISLALAFLPAAVIGLATHKKIKELLFGIKPVVGAWIVGGIAMILVERYLRRRQSQQLSFGGDKNPGPLQALKIGFFQCLALWPGTSRSMATILGGRLVGMNAPKAAEFSFLLSIPTLLAATALDLYKHGYEMKSALGLDSIFIGLVVSFVVSLLVIRLFLEFLRSYSLEAFGWYRILLGLLVLLFL